MKVADKLQVALKSVIDAFGMYATEACLLTKLTDIFNPTEVFKLDDAAISRIAAESDESVAEREDLTKKLNVLVPTMETLKRLRTIGNGGRIPHVFGIPLHYTLIRANVFS